MDNYLQEAGRHLLQLNGKESSGGGGGGGDGVRGEKLTKGS